MEYTYYWKERKRQKKKKKRHFMMLKQRVAELEEEVQKLQAANHEQSKLLRKTILEQIEEENKQRKTVVEAKIIKANPKKNAFGIGAFCVGAQILVKKGKELVFGEIIKILNTDQVMVKFPNGTAELVNQLFWQF
jgi:ATPase subunit of ABC transporter with duplicated ATPase domains